MVEAMSIVQSAPMVMNDLFALYRAECVPLLQPRSQKDYLSILDILGAAFGHREVTSMRPKDVAVFINVPKGRIHRNRMVTILSTVFKKAMGRWCLDMDLTNPCTVIERWPTKPRTRYVTDAEFDAFRATCPPQIQIAMDLALLTGQRQGDIVGLKWEQVKSEGLPRADWHIEIDQGKTGKRLAIMMSPAIETVLDRAWMAKPHWPREYVIRTNPPRGSPLKRGHRYTEDGFRALWQRCMKDWMAKGHSNFHFHDIRAKCISDNLDLDAAYLLAGHIDIKMTRKVYDRNRRKVMPLR